MFEPGLIASKVKRSQEIQVGKNAYLPSAKSQVDEIVSSHDRSFYGPDRVLEISAALLLSPANVERIEPGGDLHAAATALLAGDGDLNVHFRSVVRWARRWRSAEQ